MLERYDNRPIRAFGLRVPREFRIAMAGRPACETVPFLTGVVDRDSAGKARRHR